MRHLRLGLDDLGPALFDRGDHLLFLGDRHGSPTFGIRPGHACVCLGLIRLKAGTDVVAHVDIGNIDRHDFERRLRIESPGEHGLGDAIGIFQHVAVTSDEPMALTIPSPTRAMIVSSVAPPIN